MESPPWPAYTLTGKNFLPLLPFGLVPIYSVNVYDFFWSVVVSSNSNRKKAEATKASSLFLPEDDPQRQDKKYKDDTARNHCITGREGDRRWGPSTVHLPENRSLVS